MITGIAYWLNGCSVDELNFEVPFMDEEEAALNGYKEEVGATLLRDGQNSCQLCDSFGCPYNENKNPNVNRNVSCRVSV